MVVDVYLGGRKDYHRMNFAFVRFFDLIDAKALEDSLQGIKCRDMILQVNISKHRRKKTNLPPRTQSHRTSRHAGPQPIPPQTFGERDTRTFAQVITGNRNKHSHTPEIPIELESNTQMSLWLGKSVLIGEACSFDHISNLHASILASEGTKYLWGLNIAIRFGCSVDAKEYLEDRNRWKDWIKWLIANRFGKVINPFDNINNRRDYSMGKVDVLTSKRRWINEQITIKPDGRTYQIGVVEYTDDWSPFKLVPFDKLEEDSEDESDDDEGVLDTWMQEEDNKEEEGEFRSEDQPVINKTAPIFTDSIINPEPPMTEENNGEEVGEPRVPNSVGSSIKANTNINDPRMEEVVAVYVPQNFIIPLHMCVDLGNKMGEFNSFDTSQEPVHIKTKNVIPKFGDSQNETVQKSNSHLDSNSDRPKVKKRKRDKHGAWSLSITFFTDSLAPHQPVQSIINPIPSHLDRNGKPNYAANEVHLDDSNSCKRLQTTKIGAEIGFQISSDNLITANIVGEIGVQACVQ
ncbi:unnamed protein product [Lactuca virosa]|uniref:RRM domain-containing protein n=1 Tax=Lactuca virosa TaxID=75947 RepID=A0AAU9MA34_9ASTR|nr:unnamed protein product [Lactuca virosa]